MKKVMEKKVIRLSGNNPSPNLQEINHLGMEGWKLIDVRRDCKKNEDSYTFIRGGLNSGGLLSGIFYN